MVSSTPFLALICVAVVSLVMALTLLQLGDQLHQPAVCRRSVAVVVQTFEQPAVNNAVAAAPGVAVVVLAAGV